MKMWRTFLILVSLFTFVRYGKPIEANENIYSDSNMIYNYNVPEIEVQSNLTRVWIDGVYLIGSRVPRTYFYTAPNGYRGYLSLQQTFSNGNTVYNRYAGWAYSPNNPNIPIINRTVEEK